MKQQNKKTQGKNNVAKVTQEMLDQAGLDQAKPVASVQRKTLE